MLREIESLTTFPPKSVRLLGSLRSTVGLLKEVRRQPSYIYEFVYLLPLDMNCTVCR